MDTLPKLTTALITLGLLPIITLLSYGIMLLLAALHGQRRWLFRLVLLPGVIVHEMSHMIACWLTGTPVVEVNFWTETGGHVVHHKPRNPLVQPIISLAPFLVGITLIALLGQSLTGEWWLIAVKFVVILIIAATLAPSRADAVAMAEGAIFMLFFVGLLAWLVPFVRAALMTLLTNLYATLLLVTLMMATVWVVLHLFQAVRRH